MSTFPTTLHFHFPPLHFIEKRIPSHPCIWFLWVYQPQLSTPYPIELELSPKPSQKNVAFSTFIVKFGGRINQGWLSPLEGKLQGCELRPCHLEKLGCCECRFQVAHVSYWTQWSEKAYHTWMPRQLLLLVTLPQPLRNVDHIAGKPNEPFMQNANSLRKQPGGLTWH